MKVENNIAVKFSLISEEVKYDILEGKFVVFNNNKFYDGFKKDCVFTGVSFDLNPKVTFVCKDLDGNTIDHFLYKNYVCLDTMSKEEKLVAIVTFVPVNKQKSITSFYSYFLHVKGV